MPAKKASSTSSPSARTRRRVAESLPFDSILLEGSLFVPAELEKVTRGDGAHQSDADYQIPKGLKLDDEISRAFRIASAEYAEFHQRLDIEASRRFVSALLKTCLGYEDFTLLTAPITLHDLSYPISAQACNGALPVVIAAAGVGLDEATLSFAIQGSGSRKRTPVQLAQQYINAEPRAAWALITNGHNIRLIRDSDSLTQPRYLEFTLAAILHPDTQGGRFADFRAFWRFLHASRARVSSGQSCIWEEWRNAGLDLGSRVRASLRESVTQTLITLGTGFITHSANQTLRQALEQQTLSKQDYFTQLLRLIYRWLFLFCAEERNLLHPPQAEAEARKFYEAGFSLRRLRSRSLRRAAADAHSDLWAAMTVVFRALAVGEERLALPALGGLFSPQQCPDLDSAQITNAALLEAIRYLRWSNATGTLTAVDYRNMGPEELGSVYESLLELIPTLDLAARRFGIVGLTDDGSTVGNTRKTTGSYYTPDSLVQEVIKSTLDPVIADRLAAQPDRPVDALLSITVCDPACGSGHFLLAAGRRLAERLAELRAPDGAARPDDYRHALREVASRCLYGVDINSMAVELCRVALWLETVDPGKPLGFLNHHIRTGNSLIGATPELVAVGLPDDTFTAIEGDDKAACAELKKRNKKEREGFGPLFEKEEQSIRDRLHLSATQVDAMDDSQPAALQQKEAAFTTSEATAEYKHAKLLADLWCAAFVIQKHFRSPEGRSLTSYHPSDSSKPIESYLLQTQDELFGQSTPAPKVVNKQQPKAKNQEQRTPWGITTAHLRDFVEGKPLPGDLQSEVEALAHQYRFFHWHLAFPQIFKKGGFDCLLGNPPWKMTEEDSRVEKDASEDNEVMGAPKEGDRVRRERTFYSKSGRLPLAARNRLQLARLFAELFSTLRSKSGAAGMIIPSTVTVNAFDRPLWTHWVTANELSAVWDFVNLKPLFQEVHPQQKFALICLSGKKSSRFKVLCWLTDPSEIESQPDQIVELSRDDLHRYSGDELALPHFRGAKDLALLSMAIGSCGRLSNSVDWAPEYVLLGATNDKDFIKQRRRPICSSNESRLEHATEWIPVYEGKMVGIYDHRLARVVWNPNNAKRKAQEVELSPDEKQDPSLLATPLWEVPKTLVTSIDPDFGSRGWDIALCDVTGSLNERTALASIVPLCFATHNLPLVRVQTRNAADSTLFLAALASLPLDYFARLRVATNHLTEGIFFSLPVPRLPRIMDFSIQLFGTNHGILRRVLELTYTSWDLEKFAADCGWSGPPFRWNEERRFRLRCELDAAFFHLYLGKEDKWPEQTEALTRAFPTARDAVSYIMDTFPTVRRRDEAAHGNYRTKDTILALYDQFAESQRTGQPFVSPLHPPPAALAAAHRWPWRDLPMELPEAHREPLPFVYQYVVTVMTELVLQADGSLPWTTLRMATDLLTDRKKLARLAGPHFEKAADWLALRGDTFDVAQRFDQLSGLCHAGRMDVSSQDGELVVGLQNLDGHQYFPHIRFDARLALTVTHALAATAPDVTAEQESKKVASLVPI